MIEHEAAELGVDRLRRGTPYLAPLGLGWETPIDLPDPFPMPKDCQRTIRHADRSGRPRGVGNCRELMCGLRRIPRLLCDRLKNRKGLGRIPGFEKEPSKFRLELHPKLRIIDSPTPLSSRTHQIKRSRQAIDFAQ
jgi:hypothetical protein